MAARLSSLKISSPFDFLFCHFLLSKLKSKMSLAAVLAFFEYHPYPVKLGKQIQNQKLHHVEHNPVSSGLYESLNCVERVQFDWRI